MMTKDKNTKFSFINRRIKNYVAGFTLIELLVTVMVFSIMMIIVVSIFARAILIERRVNAAAKIQENGTFLIESMAKEIRVSTILNQDSPDCTASSLTMTHPDYGNITYTLIDGNVQKQSTITGIVNSSDVRFTRMNFCITGSTIGDQQSPKVTILLALENVVGDVITADLQTTIVSRDILIELQQ